LPLAGLATAVCVLVYCAVQQLWRHAANDPQAQVAQDAAVRLAGGQEAGAIVAGAQVDLSYSLATFVTVVNDTGAIVASSARLRGEPRVPPAGVVDYVRREGEERVTWQPEPGLRFATVAVRYPGGVVLAGRSLRENEERTAQFGHVVLIAWAAMLAGLAVLSWLSELLLSG